MKGAIMAKKRKTKAQKAEEAREAEEARLKELRGNYCFHRNKVANKEAWDAACRDYATRHFGENPTPEEWLEAALNTTCDRCDGSGRYQWGAQVNGRMTNSGPCFRCKSKGYFTDDDHRRNWGYDNHLKAV